ncbi:methyl-accepting chemotaxis protein [Halodesulfovibrio aestuarii]|uniref:Methyl-accepting chemotaxis sensory transducer with Pas/Pac sensor n=1 Tax=Halodesulfovibrio aestuarii TaxID=126333 RepID=A0A8G2C8Z5_9BACT|nr:methyl-accepting chemotaxis protein [Halodesulfovibrio aestuarii]SHJ01240.1 methyl-accepting chemotaxis sensory transducer with Pas/Pac sensor [Halodesulfovibrio aestuarii]
MSIKKLLLLGFSATIGLSLLIGIIGYKSAFKSTEQIKELIYSDVALREQALEIKNVLLQHRRYEKDIFLNTGNKQKQTNYLQKLEILSVTTQKKISEIIELESKVNDLKNNERDAIQNFPTIYTQYLNGVKHVAQLAMNSDLTPGAANKLMIQYKKPVHNLEKMLNILGKSSHEYLVLEGETSLALLNRSQTIIMVTCTVAVLFGIILAFFIFRAINTPLSELTTFANKVADGDLNAKTNSTFSGEIKILHESINRMIFELKHKLGFAEGVLNAIPTPCGIVGPDFKMLWVNQQICTLLEKEGTPESYIGVRSGELYWNDKNKETLSDRAIKERTQLQSTFECPLPSGRTLFVDVTTTPIYDLNKKIIGSVSFWYDLTELNNQKIVIEEQNNRISRAAHDASAIAEQVALEAGQLEAQINQTTHGATIQSERISETATAVEQMNATTLEVASNAARAAEGADTAQTIAADGSILVQKVVQFTEEVHQYAEDMRSTITELDTQADSIGNIINVINDIADQTNLLALNAAIEAARAGEAGRGFAVVADEVRKLAEKTMQATNEVESVVHGIQQSSKSTQTQMEKVATHIGQNTELTISAGTALEQIVDAGTETADRVRSIATASEEQSAASEQIARASDEVNTLTQEALHDMKEAADAVKTLAALSQKLETVMREIQQ